MATPQWITPAGFLGTSTERIPFYLAFETKDASTFSIISGTLPSGLKISPSGIISGTPFSVGETLTFQFVVRAANSDGITDRTFILDVSGPTDPVWLTPAGYLAVGLGQQPYVVNKSYVDYQFSAIYDVLPAGQKLRYYIGDLEGDLPPGLTLSEDGRLSGYVLDILALDNQGSRTGGYDTENFDRYPYDHSTISVGGTATRPKYLARVYQFYITVTDGVASSRRLFQLKVEDPSSFRVDTVLIDGDTTLYTADSSYLITPQWLTPVNLGYVRTSNQQVLQLKTYDPDPNTGPTTFDWTTPTTNIDGTPSVHPLHFDLDTETGALFARLPYQSAFSTKYNFTVRLIKTDAGTGEVTFLDRTFALTVKGNIENTLEFVTDENLGSIYPGYVSEFAVVAKHTMETVAIRYRMSPDTVNRLPAGLSLASDGTIIGKIKYNSQTYFDLAEYGYGEFTLDNGETTIDSEYRFTVVASDIYQSSITQKEFIIKVLEIDTKEYTQMYIRPYMDSAGRDAFSSFILDPYVFDKTLLYRPLDPEFGVQTEMKFVIEYGISKELLRVYAATLNEIFREQRFLFNGLKTAVSKDANNNVTYEVVYIELTDELGNGIDAMKNFLNDNFATDEYTMPNWMRTIQSTYGAPVGFVKAIPLCYTLPGKSDIIVKRINLTEFDFKQLDFTADRLMISSTTDHTDTKYLLFPNIKPGGTTVNNEELLVQPEGVPLLAEDGSPLELEY